jgi:dTDP-4-amino-4,6-dideoxygalactose transaminase
MVVTAFCTIPAEDRRKSVKADKVKAIARHSRWSGLRHGTDDCAAQYHEELGWNFRMSNLQAAVGMAQLQRIRETLQKNRQIGGWYQ